MTDQSDPARTCTMLYKILSTEEFTALPTPPSLWKGSPFDVSTSIVHLAAACQVQNTLSEIYSDSSSLWILAIPRTERLEPWLRFDGPGVGCAHVHLPVGEGIDVYGEVALRRPIKKGEDGVWDLGELEW
ncbi:hypothetical protein P7C70_g2251, partial [Phenoliferia sp. Uapishka_3]